MSSEKKTNSKETLVNAAKLTGEVLLTPGTSLLADGKLKSGFIHAGAGILGGLVLGIPGAAVVAANSFCISKTNKNLYKVLFKNDEKSDNGRTHMQELEKQVKDQIEKGKNLNEIKEGLAEDIEDIFAEELNQKE